MLTRLLEGRFDPLPPWTPERLRERLRERLKGMSAPELEKDAAAVLKASNPAEVLAADSYRGGALPRHAVQQAVVAPVKNAAEASPAGASHYLSKPADADQILSVYQKLSSAAGAETVEESDSEVPSLGRVEWEHIGRVPEDCGGNISRAAKLPGLHRRLPQRKLSKNPPRS